MVEEAVAKTVERFGGLDICVNNASAVKLTPILETSIKRFDLVHGVNARGTYLVTQTCLPHLLRSENPYILSISPPLLMEGALVRAARRLYYGQVRDEHGCAWSRR